MEMSHTGTGMLQSRAHRSMGRWLVWSHGDHSGRRWIGELEATGSWPNETFCLFNETNFSLVYTAGQWEQDNQYSLFDSNGDFYFQMDPTQMRAWSMTER